MRTPDLLREYVPGSVRSAAAATQSVPMGLSRRFTCWRWRARYRLAIAADVRGGSRGLAGGGASVSVLVVREGHWRFAHDKLREEPLSQLGAGREAGAAPPGGDYAGALGRRMRG